MSRAQSVRPGEGTAADWVELEAQLRELEVLMEEIDAPPSLLSSYWELSADLIALLEELAVVIAAVRTNVLSIREIHDRYRQMRQRVFGLQARAQEITLDVDDVDAPQDW